MQLEVKQNSNGFLIPCEIDRLPFKPERFFFVQNVEPGDIRGNHAHQNEEHYLICLNGSVNVTKEDRSGIVKFTMNRGEVYHQKELEWLILEYIESNTSLLVFANSKYTEDNYIRDYKEFKKILER
jgi:hypothetical protein